MEQVDGVCSHVQAGERVGLPEEPLDAFDHLSMGAGAKAIRPTKKHGVTYKN